EHVRFRQVLASRVDRAAQPRRRRRVHRRLRRAQGPTRRDRRSVAAAVVPTCLIHLLRNSVKYASKADWPAIAKQLKPVYTAPSDTAALDAFAEFSAKWERKYPAIVRLWTNAWQEFVPFLQFDIEIRKIVCSTNAIESLNARFRRAVNARGHFPTEQS